ncbi:MAG: LuxR C-terminal-related transcriptional regulator [Gordonia sp. (in: high G+C Gram-positive bacteria)]
MTLERLTQSPATRWWQLRVVIDGPLPEIAQRFSRFLAPTHPHDAMIIFTRECTGRPRKVAGAPSIVERVTIAELEDIKNSIGLGRVAEVDAVFGGTHRRVLAVRDDSDTLLVLIRTPSRTGAAIPNDLLAAWFALVSVSIRQQVAQASPDYLAESRAASSERARTIAQLTALHENTLISILGTLRDRDIDERAARTAAAQTASAALIALRRVGENNRALATEDVGVAFGRLRAELEPLLTDVSAEVAYVTPSSDDGAVPGEIAYAARAITRTIAEAFIAQPARDGTDNRVRMRIAWECRCDALVVDIRDQADGDLDGEALRAQLAGRVRTLNGLVEVEAIPGWGSRASVRIPLAAQPQRPGENLLSALNPRELEVLGHLARGRRNKAIATELGVAESTVKFHVTAILAKLQVSNRGEAGLLAARAGITAQ